MANTLVKFIKMQLDISASAEIYLKMNETVNLFLYTYFPKLDVLK